MRMGVACICIVWGLSPRSGCPEVLQTEIFERGAGRQPREKKLLLTLYCEAKSQKMSCTRARDLEERHSGVIERGCDDS
mgnify:CR=1 FL=1